MMKYFRLVDYKLCDLIHVTQKKKKKKMAIAIWKFYNNNSYITVAFRSSSLLSNIYKNKYFEKVASFTTR